MKKLLGAIVILMMNVLPSYAELLPAWKCYEMFQRFIEIGGDAPDEKDAVCDELAHDYSWTAAQKNFCYDAAAYVSYEYEITDVEDIHTICNSCQDGYWYDDSSLGCEACPDGYTYNNEYSVFVMDEDWCDIACIPGTYWLDQGGRATCELCQSGTYSDEYASTTCKFCPSGYYVGGYGNTSCEKCPDYNGIQAKTDCSSSMDGADCDNISACYVPATQKFTNEIGTWHFTDGCRYGVADDEY